MSPLQPNHKATDSTPPRAPRWVKLSAVIAIALLLLAIITMFIIGGEHSPSRHLRSDAGVYISPSTQQVQQL